MSLLLLFAGGAAPVVPVTAGNVKVEIDFGAPNVARASATWTDVTTVNNIKRVRSFGVRRGRQRETDRVAAGQATIVLDNRDRIFDPAYTAAGAPYNGNIKPMKRIRVSADDGTGTVVTIFMGFIDSWTQQYDPPRAATVIISATDAYKVLAAGQLDYSPYASEVTTDAPVHWWRLSEGTGAPIAYDSGTTPVNGAYSASGITEAGSLVAFDFSNAAQFDGAAGEIVIPGASIAAPVTYELWFSKSDTTTETAFEVGLAGSQPAVLIITSTNISFIHSTSGQGPVWTAALCDGLPHHVVITLAVEPSAADLLGARLYVDGVFRHENDLLNGDHGSGEKILIGTASSGGTTHFTGEIDEVAAYSGILSDARILAHYDAGTVGWAGDLPGERIDRVLDGIAWPAADRVLDDGLTTLQGSAVSGAALPYLQAVADSDQGLLYVTREGDVAYWDRESAANATTIDITFGDGPGETPYADITLDHSDILVYNDVRVTRESGGIEQRVQDPTSQTNYLRHTLSLQGLWNETDTTSHDIAEWLLSRYKEPEQRVVQIRVDAHRAPTVYFPLILSRDLVDRVRVIRRPQSVGSAIDQEAIIQGISHTWNASSKAWVTDFDVSPTAATDYWLAGVAGNSEAGVTTRAGY